MKYSTLRNIQGTLRNIKGTLHPRAKITLKKIAKMSPELLGLLLELLLELLLLLLLLLLLYVFTT